MMLLVETKMITFYFIRIIIHGWGLVDLEVHV